MSNIDELIIDIYADEAMPLDGKLEEQQQRRIEKVIMGSLAFPAGEDMDTVSPVPVMTDGKTGHQRKSGKKKFVVLGLVAALIAAVGLSVAAAVSHEWDIDLINFMGISNADTMQLEGGIVEIGASAVCDGTDYSRNAGGEEERVIFAATASIGDKNAAYIRIDTDYEVPDDFDESRDYILPDRSDIYVYSKNPEKHSWGVRHIGGGTVMTCAVNDGKLSFLIYLSDYKDLNRSYVDMHFENLWIYHDDGLLEADEMPEEEEQMLYEGSWDLGWQYSYKSNAETYRVLKKIRQDDETYYVTKVEVTPMAVRVEAIKNPLDRMREISKIEIEKIIYEDGHSINVEGSSSFGCRNGIGMEASCDMQTLGEALDPQQVSGIRIAGEDIRLQ